MPDGSYNDQEFRNSDGPRFHGAPTAWVDGSTGAGREIAIIDTGIFSGNAEFAGRISPDSHDIFTSRDDFEGEDDHGTIVAMIAAAANNGSGTVGIAPGATIMAIRADEPDSCGGTGGCNFGDVADGIQWAVDHGATVINISLGGASATQEEFDAVQEAADAGIVVVVASGNGGSNRPDPFPRSLADLNLGNVIIVGSVDAAGHVSDFTDKARGNEDDYLSAYGERLEVHLPDGIWEVSGTSFAAPQVAGAVALLKQAFPAMSGQQIVTLLFETAQDVGEPGLDDDFGWGIMNIHQAFQPQGTLTMPGSNLTTMSLGDTSASGSPAMGDALTTASLKTIILDKYNRAFTHDLGGSMRGAAIPYRLWGAVGGSRGFLSMTRGPAAMAFTVDRSRRLNGTDLASELSLSEFDAEKARVLAARVAMRISPNTQVGFAYAEGPDGLFAQMQGFDRPAFLVAQSPAGDNGIISHTDVSFALRRQLGRWGLTLGAESGKAISGAELQLADEGYGLRTQDAVRSLSMAFDRRFGALDATMGVTWMDEERTILGARFHDSFGGGGADTAFVDASAGWGFAKGWRLGGSLRNGWTFAGNGSLIGNGSVLYSRAWSLDLERAGVFDADDRLAFRIAQPLRVEGGALRIDLPIAYSYSTMSPTFGTRMLSLSPEGRELLGELAWRGPLWGGWGSTSLFYRREPGHYSYLPDDKGVALRWSSEF